VEDLPSSGEVLLERDEHFRRQHSEAARDLHVRVEFSERAARYSQVMDIPAIAAAGLSSAMLEGTDTEARRICALKPKRSVVGRLPTA